MLFIAAFFAGVELRHHNSSNRNHRVYRATSSYHLMGCYSHQGRNFLAFVSALRDTIGEVNIMLSETSCVIMLTVQFWPQSRTFPVAYHFGNIFIISHHTYRVSCAFVS